jgi:hypothetical protein
MTEAEWLSCCDPQKMLDFLRDRASDRKLRLFAAASFRRLVALLPDPRQRRGIEALEQLAEGAATQGLLRAVTTEVRQAIPSDEWVAGNDHPHFIALMLYREFCSSSIAVHAITATAGLADGAEEQRGQTQLLHDLFGNPFRSVTLDRAWLIWNNCTVVKLAQTIYQNRDYPSVHMNNLPILADALEDAGCENQDILCHCRGAGPHVRGCWVVDLLLGKT